MGGINVVIALDPSYIFRWAQQSSFDYPAVADQELLAGWGGVPVWPELWGYMMREQARGTFPPMDDMVKFVLGIAAPGQADVNRLRHRAQKLVMDFARDIHAFALLVHSGSFSTVSYQRIEDLQFDVDYVVRPKGQSGLVGIQTAMRRQWSADVWTRVKAARRHRRGTADWARPVFSMTNRNIPANKLPNRLWLFTKEHVEEVAAQIIGEESGFVQGTLWG